MCFPLKPNILFICSFNAGTADNPSVCFVPLGNYPTEHSQNEDRPTLMYTTINVYNIVWNITV